MAETFLSPVIGKLVELLAEEAKSFKGVHRDVKSLKNELDIIQPFLVDAEAKMQRRELNGVTKVWLKQMRDESDHIEDVVDEYMHRLAQDRRWSGFIGSLGKAARSVKALKSRYDIAFEIRCIKKSLREIKERGESYVLTTPMEQGAITSPTANVEEIVDPRLDSLFIGEEELVGIDSMSKELIRSLVQGPSARVVISLVGEGGIGKTTLAKTVYEDVEVKSHFDCRFWINIIPSDNVEKILRTIKDQICVSKDQLSGENSSIEGLINFLKNYLQTKRYVIVFDDIWQTNFWDFVKHALPSSNFGSRIMMTTRNDRIAHSCKTTPCDVVQELKAWSPESSWKLFCKKTFPFEPENHCPPELEKLSRKIVRKCVGVPLAIVTIAGLLSTKERIESEWRKVLDDLHFEFDEIYQLKNVPKVLAFSYHDLPHRLKPCFLYFGIFPENYSIDEQTLYRLWIAEGFIKLRRDNKPMEKVAEEYLNELIQRNLVSFEICDGFERHCRVHDLVREVILAAVDDLSFCQTLSGNKSKFSGKIRRLSINDTTENVFKRVGDSSIRSIFLFSGDELTKSFLVRLFEEFKLLKVLDFQGSDLDNLPKEVGNLFHLKYLSLKGTSVKSLPVSVGKLRNLQVLDVCDTLVSELPIQINKLENLRHLLASKNETKAEASLDSFRGVRIHEGIGNLENLQTLERVEACPGKISFMKDLQMLRGLKSLGISKVTAEIGNSLGTCIEKMSHLERLDLAAINEDEIIELKGISSPPPFLCFLSLKCRLRNFPDWISKLQNLQGLELFFSRLANEPLRHLQGLPNLAFLLMYLTYDGGELHFKEGGFQKLKQLSLRKLEKLEAVKIDKGALPLLEELDIGPSPLMEEMPSDIQHITNLRSLEITDMPKEFVLALQPEGGSDYWKIKHVPSVSFWYKSKGMIYKKYRLGSSKLLKHLQVDDKSRGNAPHQSKKRLNRLMAHVWNRQQSGGSSSSDDSIGTIASAEGCSLENKQNQADATLIYRVMKQRQKGEKINVQFDAKDQPLPNVSRELQSYIGVLVREHIPISFSDWKNVPRSYTDKIWEEITESFNLDESKKTTLMIFAAEKWRKFKDLLYKKHVKPNKNDPKIKFIPLEVTKRYKNIDQEHWELFVAHRLKDDDLEAQSAEQSTQQNKFDYDHRLISREKHSKLQIKMREERRSDAKTDRANRWKTSPEDKKGEHKWDKQESYIESIRGTDSSKSTEIEELKTCVCELRTMYEQLNREVYAQKHGVVPKEEVASTVKKDIDTTASTTTQLYRSDSQVASPDNDGKPCRLVLIGKDNDRVVDSGLAYDLSRNSLEGEGDLKVKVKSPSRRKAFIKEEFQTVNDGHVSSPADLVSHNKAHQKNSSGRTSSVNCTEAASHFAQEQQLKEEDAKTVINIDSLPVMLRPVVVYAEKYMDRQTTLELAMPEDVVGHEHNLWIDKQAILEFARMAEISAVCISAYIKKLYLRCYKHRTLNKFGFICPSRLAFVPEQIGDMEMERAKMLHDDVLARAQKGQQFLWPYNGGRHWMLVVINPWDDEVYWLDPLRNAIPSDVERVVQKALDMFKLRKDCENVTFHHPEGKTKWIVVQHIPMQPGSVECGFYVMKYMRDIIYKEWNPIPTHFGGITEYKDEDINEVRNEWGQYVQTLMHWQHLRV